ncbi:alanine racemase [Desulforhopalus singaporensis]|uniref:Alanine racemase n=1 Tax=Desulforhopalus singaporensis TaxID=91360 RepID=A0A1H0MR50_9BACT|nr:alanine racemase [Desulforhopalus singaporensis]SDO82881.1 alanine racemase [Desulforhopalus singaporensis]
MTIETALRKIVVRPAILERNFKNLQKFVGAGTVVMAMVKGDAYGHGMVEAAQAFARGGCTVFGVVDTVEAVTLRENGVAGKIFVTMGFDPEESGQFVKYDLTPVIYSLQAAQALNDVAKQAGTTIKVHVKVDTGMTRLGIMPGELPAFLEKIESLKNLRAAGIMSHFPESDNPRSEGTKKAIAVFSSLNEQSLKSGQTVNHIANSGAALHFPEARFGMVRAGIALYGYHPAGREATKVMAATHSLLPAMEFKTVVLQVKEVEKGVGVSYGHTFVTGGRTRLATIPVGYENGFSRSLSNRGRVLIHRQYAPIRGRICMNMCMVDVTGIAGVKAGDEVVVMGRQGQKEISADNIADTVNTISYEILCMLGKNNKKEYRLG